MRMVKDLQRKLSTLMLPVALNVKDVLTIAVDLA